MGKDSLDIRRWCKHIIVGERREILEDIKGGRRRVGGNKYKGSGDVSTLKLLVSINTLALPRSISELILLHIIKVHQNQEQIREKGEDKEWGE